jgi:SCY1-like protein 2
VLIDRGCSLLCSRSVFSIPKSIQATVILLENLHVILEKTPRDDIRSEVLPMLYNALESTTPQVQVRTCGILSVG